MALGTLADGGREGGRKGEHSEGVGLRCDGQGGHARGSFFFIYLFIFIRMQRKINSLAT